MEKRSQDERVLVIVCSEDHLQPIFSKTTASSPIKNVILEMVRNELQVDHYYVQQHLSILVRVNWDTLDIPVLRDE